MSLWDHLKPDDLHRPWSCPHCGVYENPGPHDGHVCDPRSIARTQAAQRVSRDQERELERMFNLPAARTDGR